MNYQVAYLKSFVAVAKSGSIRKAAEETKISQQTLGNHISALTREVGETLFVRHGWNLTLSSIGERFFNLSINYMEQMEAITKQSDLKKNSLKVGTGIGTSEAILLNLPGFLEQFPKLDFHLASTSDIYGIQFGEVDVCISPTKYCDPNIIQLPLFVSRIRIYASKSYLGSHPKPKSLNDLKDHRLIAYVGSEGEIKEINVHLKTEERTSPLVIVNNGVFLRMALMNDLGIGIWGYSISEIKKGELVDVFPDMPDHEIPYYFTYHKRLEGSLKIIQFYKFMKKVTMDWDPPEENKENIYDKINITEFI